MWRATNKRKLNDETEADAECGKPDDGIYVFGNSIHFNAYITQMTTFKLSRKLRELADELRNTESLYKIAPGPIWLHITTYGGEISAAWSVVDCIRSLGRPVYSVVDGTVASAGTLISLAADKRFIRSNAYIMIHQLSSHTWGKMASIECEVENLKKFMNQIRAFYLERTKLSPKKLDKLLLTDIYWSADEAIKQGLADEIYKAL